MHRIGVQLCGRIDNKLIILINISETEREVGFYRHDQWGLLALLTIHGSYRWSSSSGVITVSEALLPAQSSTRGGRQHCNRMHKHMFMFSHDVYGVDVT